jgi:O-antigen biosynthesis protein
VCHYRSVLGRLASCALSVLCRQRSVILGYHGLGSSPFHEDPHHLQITPQRFRMQLELLLEAGFEFLTVAELAERTGGSTPAPGQAALTFDDGMADNHSVLMPLLREYGLPATVYVTTGLIGKPNPWMTGGSDARMMTEEELRELVANGIELGAHTVSHPDLTQLSQSECLREMVESRRHLERVTGTPVKTFAYPHCRYSREAVAAAAAAAFTAAVTCEGRGSWSPLEMKRAMLTGKDGVPTFVLKLYDAYQPVYDNRPGRALRAATRELRRRGRASSTR